MKLCRRCGVRTASSYTRGEYEGMCIECEQELRAKNEREERQRRDAERRQEERERERQWERQREREEERARQEEIEWQRREDEERHHREMMELEERHHQELLDATLPWFPCSHCGNKTRQDKIKEVDGKKLCGDCADKIRVCQFCRKNFVMDGRKVVYTKDKNFQKKESEIQHLTYYYAGNHPYAGKQAGDQYDYIKKDLFYMCPSCYESSLKNEKETWETSRKLKVEYERLKSAKEKAEREEKERKEREEERRRREEEAKRKIAEAEKKAREEAAEKKFKTNTSAGCLGVILLVAILVISYFNDINMVGAFIGGVVAFALSMLLRSITSHLFVGLFFAVALETVLGLIISIICYFVWDAFLVPLGICFVVFLLLFTILSATGVIDVNKHSDGSTPFDAIEDFFDKFR